MTFICQSGICFALFPLDINHIIVYNYTIVDYKGECIHGEQKSISQSS